MALYSILLACFMMFLVIIYNISSAGRYYIKFTFFILSSLFNATIVMPIMFLKPRSSENALIPAFLCRQCAKVIGMSWEVRGTHNIDNTRGNIVIMNHQSSIDLVTLAVLWPLMKESAVISKRALFYLWPFGLCCWLWGTVFIDRNRKQQAQETLNKTVQAIQNRKAKILLFPEGTRNSREKLLPFKKGAFHAALDAGCPIQPVVISRYYFLDAKRPRFSSGHFVISILPPVSTEGLVKADIPDLVDRCYSLMQETYTETSAEMMKAEANNNNGAVTPKM